MYPMVQLMGWRRIGAKPKHEVIMLKKEKKVIMLLFANVHVFHQAIMR